MPVATIGTEELVFPNNSGIHPNLIANSAIIGNGSLLIAPSTSANNLVILAGTNGGITLEGTGTLGIRFADAGSESAGRIEFFNSTNIMYFYAGSGLCMGITSDKTIEFPNASDVTPTLSAAGVCSGAMFLSGGGLWYKGFAGTYTEIASS